MHFKMNKLDYLLWPMTDQFFFNVLALENTLVALNREIGDGPYFLYVKFSWIGVILVAICNCKKCPILIGLTGVQ